MVRGAEVTLTPETRQRARVWQNNQNRPHSAPRDDVDVYFLLLNAKRDAMNKQPIAGHRTVIMPEYNMPFL